MGSFLKPKPWNLDLNTFPEPKALCRRGGKCYCSSWPLGEACGCKQVRNCRLPSGVVLRIMVPSRSFPFFPVVLWLPRSYCYGVTVVMFAIIIVVTLASIDTGVIILMMLLGVYDCDACYDCDDCYDSYYCNRDHCCFSCSYYWIEVIGTIVINISAIRWCSRCGIDFGKIN